MAMPNLKYNANITNANQLIKWREYPLAQSTTALYQPYSVGREKRGWVASIYNYCSYHISKTINKIDEYPLLCNGLLLSILATNVLSLSATGVIVGAMGISYGATTLANHISGLYDHKYKNYAKFIDDTGTAVLQALCMSVVLGGVTSMLATSPLAILPSVAVMVMAAAVSAAVCTQLVRFKQSIDKAIIGEEELKNSLDRSFSPNSEELFSSVTDASLRTVLKLFLSKVLHAPLATVTVSLLTEYFTKQKQQKNFDDITLNIIRRTSGFIADLITAPLNLVSADPVVEQAIYAGLKATTSKTINLVIQATTKNLEPYVKPYIEYSKEAFNNITSYIRIKKDPILSRNNLETYASREPGKL